MPDRSENDALGRMIRLMQTANEKGLDHKDSAFIGN